MADLSQNDVLKLAALARVDLTDGEAQEFATELSAILGYVELLNYVDITGLQPTHQVTGLTNVMRSDEIADYGYEPHDLLQSAPDVSNDHLKVRRMIG